MQGRVLHALQQAELQLPAAEVRQVVAHAVPPLGHGQRAPDYEGVASKVMRGDIYRGDEGNRLRPRRTRRQAGTLFDGVKFDPAGNLEEYAGLRGEQRSRAESFGLPPDRVALVEPRQRETNYELD
jgi:hypothetical protein